MRRFLKAKKEKSNSNLCLKKITKKKSPIYEQRKKNQCIPYNLRPKCFMGKEKKKSTISNIMANNLKFSVNKHEFRKKLFK